jgi:hypothetical protein
METQPAPPTWCKIGLNPDRRFGCVHRTKGEAGGGLERQERF